MNVRRSAHECPKKLPDTYLYIRRFWGIPGVREEGCGCTIKGTAQNRI